MKKLMAVLLAVVFVAVLVPMTVSARTLTTGEQGLITKLQTTIEFPDGGFQLPKESIKQAENYLAGSETALTDEQISLIAGYFDEAAAIAKKESTGEAAKWSKETKAGVLDKVEKAAAVLGLSAQANADGTISILSATGAVLATNGQIVRVTGVSVSGIVLASVGALVLLAACAFVAKKVELF